MKTTAMQELIEWLYHIDAEELDIIELIEMVDALLDKEKKQIIDAWIDGLERAPTSRMMGEIYYNNTFGLPFDPNLN